MRSPAPAKPSVRAGAPSRPDAAEAIDRIGGDVYFLGLHEGEQIRSQSTLLGAGRTSRGGGETLPQRFTFVSLEIALDRLLEQLERGEELAARIGIVRPASAKPYEHGDQEGGVDDRRGSRIEVVVLGGDELADLVDEEANADAGEEGRCEVDEPAGQKDWQQRCREQGGAAPEGVGEMQVASADLRKAGDGQEPARSDDGGGERDERDEQVALGALAPHRASDPGGALSVRCVGHRRTLADRPRPRLDPGPR